MKAKAIVRLSLQNLWRRKTRTILTIWGMSVGIGAMVLLVSFAAGLQSQFRKMLLQGTSLTQLTVMTEKYQVTVGSGAGSVPKHFDPADEETMRSVPHVTSVFPGTSLPNLRLTVDGQTTDIMFSDTPVEMLVQDNRDSVKYGKWWNANNDNSIVLSDSTVKALKISGNELVGKTVTLQYFDYIGDTEKPINQYSVIITGVLKPSANSLAVAENDAISDGLAQKIAKDVPRAADGLKPGSFMVATVLVDDTTNVPTVKTALEKHGWSVAGADDFLKQLNQGFLMMKIVLGVIGGIALFVALIGIANAMFMAVLERIREIGIMVALGASRGTISRLFLSEAAWIGFFGSIVGLVGAYAIGRATVAIIGVVLTAQKNQGSSLSIVRFSIDGWLAAGTIVGAIIITLLAAWAPARRAAKQDPVQALRHE